MQSAHTDEVIAAELIAMESADRTLRAELEMDGSLFDGYNPRMREVHERNADRLAQIIALIGWPSPATVGEAAARSAFLVVQHAISRPAFMRSCLPLLEHAAMMGQIPRVEVAMLTDRIRTMSGKPQLYGTQFDWDESGQMSPLPIENGEREIGASEKPPADWKLQQQKASEFARSVGWRD